MRGALIGLVALCLGTGMLAALAQPAQLAGSDFPTKPIRLVVTFPPGGSTDAVVRLIAPRLSEKLGQQVLVDNRPGAGGNIGLAVVAKADADGHTLGIGLVSFMGFAPAAGRKGRATRCASVRCCGRGRLGASARRR